MQHNQLSSRKNSFKCWSKTMETQFKADYKKTDENEHL